MARKTIGIRDVARELGVVTATVRSYIDMGMPCVVEGRAAGQGLKARSWEFDLEEVENWFRAYKTKQMVGGDKETGGLTVFQEQQLRKLTAEADIAELKYAKQRDDLVHIEDVAHIVAKEYEVLKRILMALPQKLAPRVVGIGDANELQAIIKQGVIDALEELTSPESILDDERETEPEELS